MSMIHMRRVSVFGVIVILSIVGCRPDRDGASRSKDKDWATNWVRIRAPHAESIHDDAIFIKVKSMVGSDPFVKPGTGVGLGDGRAFIIYGDNPDLAFYMFSYTDAKLVSVARLERSDSEINPVILGFYDDENIWSLLQHSK